MTSLTGFLDFKPYPLEPRLIAAYKNGSVIYVIHPDQAEELAHELLELVHELRTSEVA